MYIVHLGISGFPKGNAATQRIRFTFKAAKAAGFTPLIINKHSNHEKVPYKKHTNRFEGLIFLNTSPSIIRPVSFIKRNTNKVLGVLGELRLLYRRRKKISAAILYTESFSELIYYRIISKFFAFSLVIQYVEFRSSIAERNSLSKKVNDKLFDSYCSKFCDGAIVISEFLKNEILKKKALLPVIKIPAICDFKEFEKINTPRLDYNYFLYCGTLEYMEIINFVLAFFKKIKDHQLYNGKLMLIMGVLSDSKNAVLLDKIIADNKYSDDIILRKTIPYADLIGFYKAADLLLIPLRNNLQDVARFPHKVSEYTASGRPMISSKIGELQHYFVNNESALLADTYNVDNYAETLKQMKLSNSSFDKIGQGGYDIGYKNLHYESYIEPLRYFFKTIIKK